MRFEETELWEIIIPTAAGSLETWQAVVAGKITGFSVISYELPGVWNIEEEISTLIRIACSEEKIKEIVQLTAEHYIQECVMCYKISNKCLMGYRENDSSFKLRRS